MSSHHAGTFQETLDLFESLPEEQQDSLLDILRRRRSKKRQDELRRSVAAQAEEEYADDLVCKVRSLLDRQELTTAKETAARGAKLFPGHKWLAQANKVLNPSKVTTRPVRDPGVDRGKEYEWLRKNREEYQGKWVVLLEDELIACADSFEEVVRVARSPDLKARPLVHHVE